MNILLVYPPKTMTKSFKKLTRHTIIPPLGLAYIAAVLREGGFHNIKIVDCLIEDPEVLEGHELEEGYVRYGLTDDKIKEIIQDYDPDLVGVSIPFSMSHYDALNICKIIKELKPLCKVVVGGSHPTNAPELILKNPYVDFITLGESEYTFLDLVRSMLTGATYKDISGIAYKDENRIIINPKLSFIEDIDKIPFPARDLLPMQKYIDINCPQGDSKTKYNTTIITSRGCPYDCSFCTTKTMSGKKFRARSADNVLAEIKFLIKEYNIKEFHIEDDNMTLNNKRAIEIFDKIIKEKSDISLVFPMGTAITTLTEEIIIRMKQVGVFSLSIAVESGNQEVIDKIIGKPLKLEKVKQVANWLRKHKIKSKGFFIFGMPGETKENMQQTIDYAKELKLDWCGFAIATPLPGSRLYELCKEKGYIGDIDWSNLYLNQATISTNEFTPKEVAEIYKKANIELNFKENPNLKPGGDIDQAIMDFKRVIEMAPSHTWAHLCLAKAYLIKTKKMIKYGKSSIHSG